MLPALATSPQCSTEGVSFESPPFHCPVCCHTVPETSRWCADGPHRRGALETPASYPASNPGVLPVAGRSPVPPHAVADHAVRVTIAEVSRSLLRIGETLGEVSL